MTDELSILDEAPPDEEEEEALGPPVAAGELPQGPKQCVNCLRRGTVEERAGVYRCSACWFEWPTGWRA